LDTKEIDRLNTTIGNLNEKFKINKMPGGRKNMENNQCFKASLDKFSDKNSDVAGSNKILNTNVAQNKVSNNNS